MAKAPRKVSASSLNGRTIDILNAIRNNASGKYSDLVPVAETEKSVVQIGQTLRGTPALMNEFVSALMNRIGLVTITSAMFYNYFAEFKSGELEYGETIEEVFIGIAKVRDFDPAKSNQREHAITPPNVQAAFHVINWDVQYPITIQQDELEKAFLSANGVTNMIEQIVLSLERAAEYHEWALFTYLIKRGIVDGKLKPLSVDAADPKAISKLSRSTARTMQHMNRSYTEAGVLTSSKIEDLVIVIDAVTEAELDVEVLANAFNLSRTEVVGKLLVIDNWEDFPDEQFDAIRASSDVLVEFSDEDKAILANVKMVVVDRNWFKVYDSLTRLNESFTASGDYWNYFLRKRGVYSTSPFSNAVVFLDSEQSIANPETLDFEIDTISTSEVSTVVTFVNVSDANVTNGSYRFNQTEDAVAAGIGVVQSGAVILPDGQTTVDLEVELNGDVYSDGALDLDTAKVGDTLTVTK